MVQFLSERKTSEELAKFVKAKKPPKVKMKNIDKKALLEGAHDIDHISALVSEVEIDNKGIPTLLKHYLKLDGELLGHTPLEFTMLRRAIRVVVSREFLESME